MALDASIILQGKPVQLDNPLDTYGKFLSLKDAQGTLADKEDKRKRLQRLRDLAAKAYTGETTTPGVTIGGQPGQDSNLAKLLANAPNDLPQSRPTLSRGVPLSSNAAAEDAALRGEDAGATLDAGAEIDSATAMDQIGKSTAPSDFTSNLVKNNAAPIFAKEGVIPQLQPMQVSGQSPQPVSAPSLQSLAMLGQGGQSIRPGDGQAMPQQTTPSTVTPERYDMEKLRIGLLKEGYLDEGLTVGDKQISQQGMLYQQQKQNIDLQKQKLAAVSASAQGALLQYQQLIRSGLPPEVATMRVQPYYEQSVQELVQSGVIDQRMASQVPRVFNADHAMQVYLHTIDADKALDRIMPAPPKPTELSGLIAERNAVLAQQRGAVDTSRVPAVNDGSSVGGTVPGAQGAGLATVPSNLSGGGIPAASGKISNAPPGSNQEMIDMYNAKILKDTTHQPPIVDLTNKLESKERQAQGEYNVKDYFKPLQDESFSAQKRNRQLSVLENINAKTGWGVGAASTGANILVSLGLAPDAAKEYASNSQKFTAMMQQMALEVTQGQKGAQSEADSGRINSSMVQLSNTPEANKFIVAVLKAQGNQTIDKADFVRRYFSANQTYQGAEDAWQEKNANRSLFDDPALSKYAKPSPSQSNGANPGNANLNRTSPSSVDPKNMGNANLKTPVGAPPGTTWAGYAEGSGNRVWRFPDGSMHEER